VNPARPQCGFIMLPVVVALTLLATLVYLMGRDAGMGASLAARGLDADAARYVAEAGLARMNYKAQTSNCVGYGSLDNVAFGADGFSANTSPAAGSPVTLTATGTTAGGATVTLTRSNVVVRKTTPYVMFLKPGPAGADTFINFGSATKNYGGDTALKMQASLERPLIKFDLSAIPAGSAIQTAVLSLYASNAGSAGAGDTVGAMRITRAWTEGTQAGGGTADGATWANADPSTPWTVAGGDYDAGAAAVAPYGAVVGWKSWDIAGLVDAWVNGAHPNFGVELVPSPGIFNAVFVSGDDSANASLWPSLTVTFFPPCGWVPPQILVTLTPSADSYINGNSDETNYGAQSTMQVYESGERRGVLRFNLSSVPAGTPLADARLRLYVSSLAARSGGTMNLRVHALTSSWTENHVSWDERTASAEWSSEGGDYHPAAAATLALPASFSSGWIEFSVTALAQAWVDGVTPNDGVIVLELSPDQFSIASKEGSGSTSPQLVLTY
jgi:hypothetical protein